MNITKELRSEVSTLTWLIPVIINFVLFTKPQKIERIIDSLRPVFYDQRQPKAQRYSIYYDVRWRKAASFPIGEQNFLALNNLNNLSDKLRHPTSVARVAPVAETY